MRRITLQPFKRCICRPETEQFDLPLEFPENTWQIHTSIQWLWKRWSDFQQPDSASF